MKRLVFLTLALMIGVISLVFADPTATPTVTPTITLTPTVTSTARSCTSAVAFTAGVAFDITNPVDEFYLLSAPAGVYTFVLNSGTTGAYAHKDPAACYTPGATLYQGAAATPFVHSGGTLWVQAYLPTGVPPWNAQINYVTYTPTPTNSPTRTPTTSPTVTLTATALPASNTPTLTPTSTATPVVSAMPGFCTGGRIGGTAYDLNCNDTVDRPQYLRLPNWSYQYAWQPGYIWTDSEDGGTYVNDLTGKANKLAVYTPTPIGTLTNTPTNTYTATATNTPTVTNTPTLTTIGNGSVQVAVDSSDWDIDATGVMTGIGNVTTDGTLTLQNAEIVDNATDAQIQVTFDDDAAILGTLQLNTSIAPTAIAVNDTYGIQFNAPNASSTPIPYNVIYGGIYDKTAGSEDGFMQFKSYDGGSIAAWLSYYNDKVSIGTTSAGEIALGNATSTFEIESSAIDIDTSGNITNAGSIGAGAITGTSLNATDGNLEDVGTIECDTIGPDGTSLSLDTYTTGSNTVKIRGYDTGDAGYVDAITVTAGADATVAIGASNIVTTFNGNINVAGPSDGGNKGVANYIEGLIKIHLDAFGAMNDGSETVNIIDDNPTGEWSAIAAECTVTADTSYYRIGANSLKLAFTASALAANGATNTLASGDQDWSDDESVGLWARSDRVTDANDLALVITGNPAGDTSVNLPAITVANQWQWLEIDISAVPNASKDVITDISFELTTGSGLIGSASNIYLDYAWKWDAAEEIQLDYDVLGIQSVVVGPIDAATANTTSNIIEGTDFLINYQTGADVLIPITDQHLYYGQALYLYND